MKISRKLKKTLTVTNNWSKDPFAVNQVNCEKIHRDQTDQKIGNRQVHNVQVVHCSQFFIRDERVQDNHIAHNGKET